MGFQSTTIWFIFVAEGEPQKNKKKEKPTTPKGGQFFLTV